MTASTSRSRTGTLVVFGGASGIGLATAVLGEGVYEHVVIADLNESALEPAPVHDRGRLFERCDASSAEQVSSLLDRITADFGTVDAVVTTVGGGHFFDPLEIDLDGWRREVSFNLESAYVVATAACKRMVAAGRGAVVTTSSSFAHIPTQNRVAYAAAKAGVISLTKSLALTVASRNVRVNCVAPGATDTPRLRKIVGDPSAFAAKVEALPQERMTTPEDVAQAILFLTSDAATSITGQVLWVNNGAYMP